VSKLLCPGNTNRGYGMAHTLADLDAMSIAEAQALPFDQRNGLLDMIIADGRHQSTDMVSYRNGLYCDYFEEDLVRMLKVKGVKVSCRGTTSSGFDGVIVGDSEEEQYRAAFSHIKTTLEAAGSSFERVVSLMVFLTDMDNWPLLNEIYREYVPNPPCRAVIGTTGLAQKPLAIEIVECIAYRVAP
jgi:enamine deaminase RidA (YjgF/YER057c/UK114 family)